MALNYLWIGFFLIAFIVALLRVIGYYFRDFMLEQWGLVFGKADLEVFGTIMESTFSMAETSVEISIYLIGVITLWMGLLKVGEHGGAVRALSTVVSPFFQRLFPEVPKDHPAIGAMMMNFSANMLGLDNAATPMGLKAMKELQEINPQKDTASNAQIMFLVLNTSGLTLVPISVMAIRASLGAANPADIFIPILCATYFASLAGLISVSIVQRIKLFHPVILAYLGVITALIGGMLAIFNFLPADEVKAYSALGGNFILFGFIILFIGLALRNKVNVYNSFIEGAKEGFDVAVKIIPYLVAMLVAIGVFRASGAFDMVLAGFKNLVLLTGANADFVDAMPVAFMKPLSGSGARGMMVEAIEHCGVDSFVGQLASTMQGSTETTFYTLAVYYGAVQVTRTRHTVACGLIADLAGIIAAIFIAYIFFSNSPVCGT